MPRTKRQGLSAEEMQERFPLLRTLTGEASTADAWTEALDDRPDVVVAILGDLIKQTYAVKGKVGQRPMPTEAEVDVDDLLYGEVSDRPLTELLPEMVVSQRDFARRVMMSRTQLQRVMIGEVLPDFDQFARIANALRRSPMYFLEYRKMVALKLVARAMDARPVVASRLIAAAQED